MDDRNNLPPGGVNPGQIREGAGLEESRINQDFVDLLKKYSTPVMLLLVIIAAGYFGLVRYREAQARALDAAFLELNQAEQAGSPDGLLAVADAHEGQRAVSTLARLRAADIHLGAARTRVAVAAPLNPDGTAQNESDILTDEQRADHLDQAAALYQRVINDATGQGAGVNVTAINAMFGLAAVEETRGNLEAAADWYTQIADRSAAAGLVRLEKVANERKASLDKLAEPPALYSLSQLPAPPAAPATPGMGGPMVTGPDGQPMQMERIDAPPGVIAPGTPTPIEAPAQPATPAAPGDPGDNIPLAPGTSGKPEPAPGG